MQKILALLVLATILCFSGCAATASAESASNTGATAGADILKINRNTTVGEIIADPAFGNFGRLLFPVDRAVTEDMTLAEVSTSNIYVWYSDIQPDMTVEIISHLKERSENGEQVFYSIYSENEIAEDPSKADTGLFFFRGGAGNPFAIMNAGGGFMSLDNAILRDVNSKNF